MDDEMQPGAPRWIFCDLETTGLSVEDGDNILEVALVVVDAQLREVATFSRVVAYPSDELKATAHEVVQRMHEQNGLWVACQNAWGVDGPEHDPTTRVMNEAVAFLKAVAPELVGKTPIAGDSIHFDRTFLRAEMPELERCFSHRNLDVSVLREVAGAYAPAVYASKPEVKGHRALEDARCSVKKFGHYLIQLCGIDYKAGAL